MADQVDPDALDAAIKLMAPIISHEIRNPLAVIGNSAYFVKSKLEILKVSDPKVKKHLAHIETELRHANEVLGDMLLYARMKEPALSATPLASVVSEAVSELAVPEGAKLDNKAGAKSPSAMVDPELASRSVRHLVRNAYEAAGPGGLVTVQAAAGKGGVVTVTVTDSGPGFAQELEGRMFIPFQTTRPRGIGLGLAYVKKTAERMGGTVEASAPGAPKAWVRVNWRAA
ncbi:MAG: HAMP domain-containing histidine kinase [Elusimicrobia bacterium]|nr:HAMP domain-containing histidine kinase [Elusimicrobiota bacterium]